MAEPSDNAIYAEWIAARPRDWAGSPGALECIQRRALYRRGKADAEAYSKQLEAERDAEIEGTMDLRSRCGARDNETFPGFVERLAREAARTFAEADVERLARNYAVNRGTIVVPSQWDDDILAYNHKLEYRTIARFFLAELGFKPAEQDKTRDRPPFTDELDRVAPSGAESGHLSEAPGASSSTAIPGSQKARELRMIELLESANAAHYRALALCEDLYRRQTGMEFP